MRTIVDDDVQIFQINPLVQLLYIVPSGGIAEESLDPVLAKLGVWLSIDTKDHRSRKVVAPASERAALPIMGCAPTNHRTMSIRDQGSDADFKEPHHLPAFEPEKYLIRRCILHFVRSIVAKDIRQFCPRHRCLPFVKSSREHCTTRGFGIQLISRD